MKSFVCELSTFGRGHAGQDIQSWDIEVTANSTGVFDEVLLALVFW